VKEMLVSPFRVFSAVARPRTLPLEAVLLWNRVLVQSLRPSKYHRHWFGNPALPLALASAVRFSFNGLLPETFEVTGRTLSSSFTFPLEYYPTAPTRTPQHSGPLMGFCSLQHSRNSRSTSRGLARPLRSVFRVWLPS